MKRLLLLGFCFWSLQLQAARILIPMDKAQRDHLKSYGIAYFSLQHFCYFGA
jgi:hypothetical protein